MPTPQRLFVNEENMAICADLYELTMAAAYFTNGAVFPATFELSVRRLPQPQAGLPADRPRRHVPQRHNRPVDREAKRDAAVEMRDARRTNSW